MIARPVVAGALVLVALSFAHVARGQDDPSPMDKATAHAAESTHADRDDEAKSAMPESPSSVVLADPTTRQRYLDSMQRYYEYRASGFAYRSRLFEWQLMSSRVIFLVVLVLVSCGIYFAWVQFRAALLAVGRGIGTAVDAVANPLATQLELSAKGIVINSSVLGIVILGLSLAFFYLYLVYVYPIQNVF
jgi:hypothetical protein